MARELVMSFDPHTIEHLGVKMYSVLPNAIAELIANAYDADASNVRIELADINGEKSISIVDDGVGMSFDEINEKFLRIGRRRREEDNGKSPSGKRKVTGRKGLGKLAFFGIGNTISIQTVQNGKCVFFEMKWDELTEIKSSSEYKPHFKISDCNDKSGTRIILKNLKRKSAFDKKALAVSLSKLFNFFDNTFNVFIALNGDKPLKIDNDLKYENLCAQIEWILPDKITKNFSYFEDHLISGKIIATEKPLKPGLRGITLFAHGRLVNAPEFFGVGESSHGYSYLTGWLNVDFVDESPEDVISTDRQSLSWDLPETEQLRKELQNLLRIVEKEWRKKRKEQRTQRISEKSGVNINTWFTKLPQSIKDGIEPIVTTIIEDSELVSNKQKELIESLHKLLPEYTYYHYRSLHKIVKEVSEEGYQNKDYYRAFEETIKRYILEIQRKSGSPCTDSDLTNKVFGKENHKILKVAKKYKRTAGDEFNTSTLENIEEGQRWLSSGIIIGARNPIAHEEIADLQKSGLFSEKDCLDALSLLSHLFRRLDNAEKVVPNEGKD